MKAAALTLSAYASVNSSRYKVVLEWNTSEAIAVWKVHQKNKLLLNRWTNS